MKLSPRVLAKSLQANHPDLHLPLLLMIFLQLEMETIAWQEGIIDTRLYLFSSSTGCQLLHNITYLHSGTQNIHTGDKHTKIF